MLSGIGLEPPVSAYTGAPRPSMGPTLGSVDLTTESWLSFRRERPADRPTSHEPLACPVVAFGGSEDETVPEEHLRDWSSVTTGTFQAHILPGDHFSLLREDQLPDRIGRVLQALPH